MITSQLGLICNSQVISIIVIIISFSNHFQLGLISISSTSLHNLEVLALKQTCMHVLSLWDLYLHLFVICIYIFLEFVFTSLWDLYLHLCNTAHFFQFLRMATITKVLSLDLTIRGYHFDNLDDYSDQNLLIIIMMIPLKYVNTY